MIEITAIRMTATGKGHEHIAAFQWRNTQTGGAGQSSREIIVNWLEESKANQAVVANSGSWVYVAVRRPQGQQPYVQTHADGEWSDNLLALPPF